jgi:O-antigen ligase
MQNKTAVSKGENRLILVFCLITAILPICMVNIPRSYGFTPAISGLLFFVLYFCIGDQKPKLSIKTALLAATIIGISSISLLWAEYFETSKEKVFKLLALLPAQVLLISLATSLNKEQLKPLANCLPIGFLIACGLLIFEIITQGTLHNIIRGEDTFVVTDPDAFNRGAVALALYSFPVFALLSNKLSKATAILVTFLPVIAAISISEALASQLALILGLMFLFAFPYKNKISLKILKFAILTLILAAPFCVSFVYQNFAASLQEISFMANGYAGHRLEVWDYVSRYAMQNPLLGFGIEATGDIKDFETGGIFYHLSDILHPHNFVIQIFIEFGFLGLAIAMGLIYALFTNIEKLSIAKQKIILPTLMATLVPAAFSYGLWQGLWLGLMFHIAAVTLMAATLADKDENQ